jgi:hypothetical protein
MKEKKAFKFYSKLAVSESNPEVRSGRAPRLKLKSLNVHILKQHSRLPFHFTQEDLIIEAPFE